MVIGGAGTGVPLEDPCQPLDEPDDELLLLEEEPEVEPVVLELVEEVMLPELEPLVDQPPLVLPELDPLLEEDEELELLPLEEPLPPEDEPLEPDEPWPLEPP